MISLGKNDVHIWVCPLAQFKGQDSANYWALMSGGEHTRNLRYRFDKDRLADRVSRALVRSTLSLYVDMSPESFEFSIGEHGKPEVANAPQPIRINLSHTAHFAICALSAGADVGLDIECTERKNDVLAIADHYFSAREVDDLFALPKAQQQDRFFDYWTLKEAYMKARGEGISLGLGNFSFDLTSRAQPLISFGPKLKDDPNDWQFRLFQPARDHRLALAFRSDTSPRLRFFQAIPLKDHAEIADAWCAGLAS